jgi:hypothetical protein
VRKWRVSWVSCLVVKAEIRVAFEAANQSDAHEASRVKGFRRDHGRP